jgi:hypothetical protein
MSGTFDSLDMIHYRVPMKMRTKLRNVSQKEELFQDIKDTFEGEIPNFAEPLSVEQSKSHRIWHDCVEYFVSSKRLTDALWFCEHWYEHLSDWQCGSGRSRVHKGDCLWVMSIIHDHAGRTWHANHCRMLGILEDAQNHIQDGKLTNLYKDYGASYHWLQKACEIDETQIPQLLMHMREMINEKVRPNLNAFPEASFRLVYADGENVRPEECTYAALKERIKNHSKNPSTADFDYTWHSGRFVKELLSSCSDAGATPADKGMALEDLAFHLLSTLPGCVCWSTHTNTDQLDLAGRFDPDWPRFDSEFGRYFIVECKNTEDRARTADIRRLSDIMSVRRVKLGLFICMAGFTQDEQRFAHLARRESYTRHGSIILFLSKKEIEHVVNDRASFVNLMQRDFERVKLGS